MQAVCNRGPQAQTVISSDLPQRIPLPNGWSHLRFHVSIFAEQDLPIEQRRFITFNSAFKVMKEIGMKFTSAFQTAGGVTLALPQKTGGEHHQIDIQNIVKAEHPLDSKIFDKEGMFDNAQFEALMLGYGKTYHGERVLPESSLKKMHADFKKRDEKITSCMDRFISGLTSDGEFNGLFEVFADETMDNDGVKERFIREDLFRSFYLDGPFVFMVAKHYQKIEKAQTINQIYKAAVASAA